MHVNELRTPAVLVDLDVMERNIRAYQEACNAHGKQLWPMVKTHKSAEIALMQQQAGAGGFLCGTLDECEALCRAGIGTIMYAYPVAGKVSVERVIALAKACDFIIRLDCSEGARELNAAAEAAGIVVNYTLIVDTGLHRFGMPPDELAAFALQLRHFKHLAFKGISTHPGQVYAGSSPEDVAACAADETRLMAEARHELEEAGFACAIVSSGSTPTFAHAVSDPGIHVYHPGNYVFHDVLQMRLGAAKAGDCALSVLATVISRPTLDRVIIDAGAKCLGLDQGAHGHGTLSTFGYIQGYPDLELYSLSEEVGKIRIKPGCPLRVGDRVRIVPNHACSSANLSSWLIGCRRNEVERMIKVDIRSNSTTCGVAL